MMQPGHKIEGYATAAGTEAWTERFPQLRERQFFRPTRGLADGAWQVSSLGIGTYLGAADDDADDRYEEALAAALAGGVDWLDTAINYRHQRSERVIGRLLARGQVPRESLIVSTKAGFFPFDGELPPDPQRYLHETYIASGLARPGDIAGGSHCMAPVFLADQLRRSRENLGLATIDIFYLHNPETQAAELSREEFYRRLRAAFEFLERAAAQGEIRYYGVATWSGFRLPPDRPGYLELSRMAAVARDVAGEAHRFRFVQLPYNLAMPEASVLMNQPVERPPYISLLGAAARLGVNLVASASLASGQLRQLPPDALAHLRAFLPDAETPVEFALQFARAGTTTALVGMGRKEHVAANLRVAAMRPPTAVEISRLLRQ